MTQTQIFYKVYYIYIAKCEMACAPRKPHEPDGISTIPPLLGNRDRCSHYIEYYSYIRISARNRAQSQVYEASEAQRASTRFENRAHAQYHIPQYPEYALCIFLPHRDFACAQTAASRASQGVIVSRELHRFHTS